MNCCCWFCNPRGSVRCCFGLHKFLELERHVWEVKELEGQHPGLLSACCWGVWYGRAFDNLENPHRKLQLVWLFSGWLQRQNHGCTLQENRNKMISYVCCFGFCQAPFSRWRGTVRFTPPKNPEMKRWERRKRCSRTSLVRRKMTMCTNVGNLMVLETFVTSIHQLLKHELW